PHSCGFASRDRRALGAVGLRRCPALPVLSSCYRPMTNAPSMPHAKAIEESVAKAIHTLSRSCIGHGRKQATEETRMRAMSTVERRRVTLSLAAALTLALHGHAEAQAPEDPALRVPAAQTP